MAREAITGIPAGDRGRGLGIVWESLPPPGQIVRAGDSLILSIAQDRAGGQKQSGIARHDLRKRRRRPGILEAYYAVVVFSEEFAARCNCSQSLFEIFSKT